MMLPQGPVKSQCHVNPSRKSTAALPEGLKVYFRNDLANKNYSEDGDSIWLRLAVLYGPIGWHHLLFGLTVFLSLLSFYYSCCLARCTPDFYLPQLFSSSCFPPLSGERGSIYNRPCSTEVILTAAEKETYENLIAKKLQYILGLSELSDMQRERRSGRKGSGADQGGQRKGQWGRLWGIATAKSIVFWCCILQKLTNCFSFSFLSQFGSKHLRNV